MVSAERICKQSKPDTSVPAGGGGDAVFCTRRAEPDCGAERLPGSPSLQAEAEQMLL